MCQIQVRQYYERKKKEYIKEKKKKKKRGRGDEVPRKQGGGSKKDRGGGAGAVKVKRGIWDDFWTPSSTTSTNIITTTEVSTQRSGRALPLVPLTPLVLTGGVHVTKETIKYLGKY